MAHGHIPSLNWLRVFESAARHQSFARAAADLNMSAPAVSQQVRALETHLGTQLFLRAARGVTLTDEGRAFLPAVHQALASVEATASALFAGHGPARVSLQVVTVLAFGWMPRVLAAFRQNAPHVQITLTTGNQLDDFTASDMRTPPDIQILYGATGEIPADAAPLFGDWLEIVGRPELVSQVTEPAHIPRHTLIEVASHRAGWHRMLSQWPDLDTSAQTYLMTDTSALALRLAGEGLGLALARRPATDLLGQEHGLIPLPFSSRIEGLQQFALVTTPRAARRSEVRALRDWILQAAQDTGNDDGGAVRAASWDGPTRAS